MNLRRVGAACGVVLLAFVIWVAMPSAHSIDQTSPNFSFVVEQESNSDVADDQIPHVSQAEWLANVYDRWSERYTFGGGDRFLVLNVGRSMKHGSQMGRGKGRFTFDLVDHVVKAELSGLETGVRYDAWLIDNQDREGDTVQPEAGDDAIHLGELKEVNEGWQISAPLDERVFDSFDIDMVVITRDGVPPHEALELFGLPSLFQRLYLADRREGFMSHGIANVKHKDDWKYRPDKNHRAKVLLARRRLAQLIEKGERLFFEETFRGNGRTCGTCHRAENNLTIDPKFIATLPKTDRLFVAEPQFANQFPGLQENFENPVLMRQFGLIVENVDGTDDLENKFTMRGVPHTLAMPTSLTPAPFDGTDPNVVQRTGWSGDGAPGDGSLRSFATGAVRQHFTKSTERREGVDFRFPNDKELDAMEAFQLSLGRQEEVDLTQITFKDSDAAAGLVVFNGAGVCANCHFNAGSNISFIPPAGVLNANFDTGVESLPHPGLALGETIPRDGGFGTGVGPNGGFGDGTFNTTTLIEAADTGPYFHNNVIESLEDAIAFYSTDAFNDSPAAQFTGPINLTDEQIRNVGKLLRVLNATENIASAVNCLGDAAQSSSRKSKHKLMVCAAEIEDAIEVLSEVGLHDKAVKLLTVAKKLVDDSARRGHGARRSMLLAAYKLLGQARDEMVEINEPEG